MRMIGYHIGMVYGCGGSSASTIVAKSILKNYYGYNASIVHSDYHIDNICSNLRAGYPVIISGYRTKHPALGVNWYTNGHSWVCDGLWEEYDRYEEICYTRGGTPAYNNNNKKL